MENVGLIFFISVNFGFIILIIFLVIRSKRSTDSANVRDHCPICKSIDRNKIEDESWTSYDTRNSQSDPVYGPITYNRGHYQCANCKTNYGEWSNSTGAPKIGPSESGCRVILIIVALLMACFIANLISMEFFGMALF